MSAPVKEPCPRCGEVGRAGPGWDCACVTPSLGWQRPRDPEVVQAELDARAKLMVDAINSPVPVPDDCPHSWKHGQADVTCLLCGASKGDPRVPVPDEGCDKCAGTGVQSVSFGNLGGSVDCDCRTTPVPGPVVNEVAEALAEGLYYGTDRLFPWEALADDHANKVKYREEAGLILSFPPIAAAFEAQAKLEAAEARADLAAVDHQYRLVWQYPNGSTRAREWQDGVGTLIADAFVLDSKGLPAWIEVRDLSAPRRWDEKGGEL